MGCCQRCCLLAFVSDCGWSQPEDIPDYIPVRSGRSTMSSRLVRHMTLPFPRALREGLPDCQNSLCPAAESAVGAAGRESAEAQRQRAGAQGPEEGDGGDEGESEGFQSRRSRKFLFCTTKIWVFRPPFNSFARSTDYTFRL